MNAQPNRTRSRFIAALALFCQLIAGPAAILHAAEHGAELASAQVAVEAAADAYVSHVPGCDICRSSGTGFMETRQPVDLLRPPTPTTRAGYPETQHLAALEPHLPPPARAPPTR